MNTAAQSLRDQPKAYAYGRSAALCIEAVTSRGGVPTVNVEVAKSNGTSVDWGNKITVQPSATELPMLVALMLGYRSTLEMKRPGKGIEIKRQQGGFYVRASTTGQAPSLPVTGGDGFNLLSVMLGQLTAASGLSGSLLMASVRGTCSE